jgi:glycosyltransferase involved in cell wall biosynthesis
MIKSVLFTTAVFPPDIGGPASYIPLVATEFAKLGIKVKVVTLSDKQYYDFDKEYNFKVVRINRKIKKPFRDFLVINKIIKEAKMADLIFSNTLAFESVIAAKIINKPVLQKVVGDLAWERARFSGRYKKSIDEYQKDRNLCLKSRLTNLYRNIGIKLSSHIITPSNYLKKLVVNWGYPENKIDVVYNSIDLPKIENFKRKSDKFRLITVCRMVPWKGVDKILEAVARIKDIEFVAVGDGEYLEKYKKLANNLKIDNRVKFLGKLSHENTLREIAKSDLFILNSSYKGLPHVVIEAFNCKIPVIASKVGGTPEIVIDGKTGLLFRYNSVEEIIDKILLLKSLENLRKFLINNSQLILNKFTVEYMIKDTLRVINSI